MDSMGNARRAGFGEMYREKEDVSNNWLFCGSTREPRLSTVVWLQVGGAQQGTIDGK